MKKIFSILFTLVLVVSMSLVMAMPTAAGDEEVTVHYGDITLPPGGGFFLQPHVWDLNACDVTVSYTLDLSGAPNVAYTGNYGQSGYVGLIWPGSTWAGAWMSGFLADWDNSGTEFPTYPDNDGSQDLDDKFNMQRSPNPGSWSETMYDVYCEDNTIAETPFGSGDNYGIWFDRDGVNQWQATMWGMVDGGTYNTLGVYDVEILYHKGSSAKGTACPLFFPDLTNDDAPSSFGIPTGFNPQSDGSYADFPAGISFDTDETKMGNMQVFVSGNPGDGTIVVKNLTVTGCGTLPMSEFQIDHAKLDFKKKADDDKVHVRGTLELDLANGDGVDISDPVSEPVTVTVGSLSPQTIVMEQKGKKGEKWEYKRPKGESGIKHMKIDWKKYPEAKFDIRVDKVDLGEMSDWTNPVTISIQIGDDVGEEDITMREKKHHWDYKVKKHH